MALTKSTLLGISLAFSINLGASPVFANCSRSATTKVAGDPLSIEQLRTLADQSKTTLSRLTTLVGELQQSLPTTLPPPAQQALSAISVHIGKGTKAADDALASGQDEEKLRYKMATLTSEIEITRSALTRLKLGLSGVELSTTSKAHLEQLEKEIDDLRSSLQSLRSPAESTP